MAGPLNGEAVDLDIVHDDTELELVAVVLYAQDTAVGYEVPFPVPVA